MYQCDISVRLTHKYRDAWSYMDRFHQLTTVKEFPPRLVREGNDYDDVGTTVTYIEVADKSLPLKQVTRAIRDTYSGNNCNHEYDCCGCILRSVRDVRRIGRGRFTFVTEVRRNY